MKTTSSILTCWLAGVLLLAASSSAAPPTCAGGGRPAATLLVPYFEVDLASREGPGTIFSVGNAGAEPVIAHVVLWTDRGLPSLDFDLHLGPDGLQTIDLRSLFERGELPRTGAAGSAPGCASPIALPDLEEAALAELTAKHTGLPSPVDGLCYGSATGLAVGYVTVDAMNGCSATIRRPGDDGYFEAGGSGLASNRNVLWGDVFYVDSGSDGAQGFEAVAIRADADRFLDGTGSSFYRLYVEPHDGRDNRIPLGHRYRSRFLNGGGASMTSEVIVWTEGLGPAASPRECLEPFPELPSQEMRLVASFRDQKGAAAGAVVELLHERTVKLAVGAEPLVPEAGFGQIDVETGVNCNVCLAGPTQYFSVQTWTTAVLRAAGRFSTAQHATRVDGECP